MVYCFELGVQGGVAPFVGPVAGAGDGGAAFDEDAAYGDFVRVEGFFCLCGQDFLYDGYREGEWKVSCRREKSAEGEGGA